MIYIALRCISSFLVSFEAEKHGGNGAKVYIFQRPMHDTVKLLMSTDQMDAESPVAVVHLFEKHAFMNIWVFPKMAVPQNTPK